MSQSQRSETYQCNSSIEITPYIDDNLNNHVAESTISPCMKELDCWVGIDEAGRGPVLGPMVYGIAYSPIEKQEEMKKMGFADSKTLSEEQRDNAFDELNTKPDVLGWMVHILSPHHISNCMLRRTKYNLNELSHDTAIGLIRRVLDQGVRVTEVYVDTVGPPEKYQDKLQRLFPQLKITVSKKADSLYPIVSAASICAKVARDKAIATWKFTEPVEFSGDLGSGYPGDPKTKEFLNRNIDAVFGFPKIVRFSWSTAAKLLEEKATPVKWADDEDEELVKMKKRKKTLANFFSPDKDSLAAKSFKYFTERKLCNSVCL